MFFHKLKRFHLDQSTLDLEVIRLVQSLRDQLGPRLVDVYIFGSASKGVEAMHQYSDVDLCLVVFDDTPIKELYGKLPRSTIVPVDWLIVTKSEFEDKYTRKHGVYHLIAAEGRRLTKGPSYNHA